MALTIRGLMPGDGRPLAELWRDLWLLHESWGGYATDTNPAVFIALEKRLEDDASARGGATGLGRHVHLVAETNGQVVGQVEGWLEQFGTHSSTLPTCEIRSLIVSPRARTSGLGRALLNELERGAVGFFRARCAMAAEVLEPNPAQAFYEHLGFRPVSYTLSASPPSTRAITPSSVVRLAKPGDELMVAKFESWLSDRRRRAGDLRFDPPAPIDASWLTAIRHVLATESPESDRATFVAESAAGEITGTAQFMMHALDPPFAQVWRAVLSRVVVNESDPDAPGALLAFALRQTARRRAARLEVTDCPPPGSTLHAQLLHAGAKPWSRIVQRIGPAR